MREGLACIHHHINNEKHEVRAENINHVAIPIEIIFVACVVVLPRSNQLSTISYPLQQVL